MASLGDLERAVMEVLWADGGTITARTVAEALAAAGRDDLAYTTVLTVLGRLERKGVVRRTRDGRAHGYAASGTRAEHTAALMRAALGTAGDRDAALARFVGTVTPEEAEVLRRALEEHRPGP